MKLLTLRYSIILLIGFLVQWWIFYFSPFHIPDKIPLTPIRIDGLVLVGYIITILIFYQKKLLKSQPSKRILELTLLGTIMCFYAEIAFQVLRIPTMEADLIGEKIYYVLRGIIGISAFAAVLSFFIAFQLKTHRTRQLLLLIIAFLFIFYFGATQLSPAFGQ